MTTVLKRCFGSGTPWIRIEFRRLDPDPGGQKWYTQKQRSTKIEKSEETSYFEVLRVLFC
jgi:hypothetical protein